MKIFLRVALLLLPFHAISQDSLMNSLTAEMNNATQNEKEPVKIFNSSKAINANTTEMVGRGKMDFRVTHNFDDIDGKGGIFGRFLGLDNVRDARIAFHIGLSDRVDLNIARVKGAASVNKLYELALKFLLSQQIENDPRHPLSIALFVNNVIATSKSSALPNFENTFEDFSDRMSQVIQLIVARKMGSVSLQLNPTFVHTNHVVINDDKSIFALGAAIRFPVTRNFNIILDYFHPFRSKESKEFFKTVDNTYDPPNDIIVNPKSLRFYDPVGISFEVVTPGHVFNLNFTNATEILENRFIPRTTTSWGKGQFRWGFTIARKFVLKRQKN